MSETAIAGIIMAAIAALPPTLAALSARRLVKQNDVKTDQLIVKSDVIHELTNSNLSSVKAELAEDKMHIKELQVLVNKLAAQENNN